MNLPYFVLIDKNFKEHEIFQKALEQSGHFFDLISYFEPGEALKMFDSHFGGIPNFVFIGADTVTLESLEVFKGVKSVTGFNRVQVILYVKKADLSDILNADDYGVSHVILKQENESGLSKILKHLLIRVFYCFILIVKIALLELFFLLALV